MCFHAEIPGRGPGFELSPRLPPPSSSLRHLPQCSHPILPVPHPPDLGRPAQPISIFSLIFTVFCSPPHPPAANPVSLVPSSCPIWSVSPFPEIGSLLVFARVPPVAPASSLSPSLSLGACDGGEVLCPSVLRAASPCPSPMLCTPVCLQSPPYTCTCQFLPSNLLLLRPHWGVGGGSWWGQPGSQRVKVLLWWGAGGQHLGGASRPQIRQ